MRKFVAILALIGGAVTFTACDSFGQAMTSNTDVLARAAGTELTVDQAVNMLAPYPAVPAKVEIVDAIANLWVDFVLLATAAHEDSTLSQIDLAASLTPYFNQQLVYKLRDKVITVDTTLADPELRALFDKEQPGAQVKARHILLQLPADATPQQRDSVTALARQLRDQAKAGADFTALAKQYSQEPNAAQSGGDLGYFTYETMVPQFSQVAFAMQPGEISDVVETSFGLHIIKVEDRKTANFDESKENFRQATIAKRYQDAEKAYLDALMTEQSMEVQDGAIDVARELAKKPDTRLSRRAGNRELVKFKSGELTAKEYVTIMQGRAAEQRTQVAQATDDELKEWLRVLSRDEVLILRAKDAGVTNDMAEVDSLRKQVHTQLVDMSKATGLNPIKVADGQDAKAAIAAAVATYLDKVLKNEMQIVRLGAVSYVLRDKYDAEVFDRSIPAVITKLEAKRPPAPANQMPPGMQMPMPMPQPQSPPPAGGGQ